MPKAVADPGTETGRTTYTPVWVPGTLPMKGLLQNGRGDAGDCPLCNAPASACYFFVCAPSSGGFAFHLQADVTGKRSKEKADSGFLQ